MSPSAPLPRSVSGVSWAFATGQPFARRWAHDTPGGKGARYRALPMKKKTARSRVRKAAGTFHTTLDL